MGPAHDTLSGGAAGPAAATERRPGLAAPGGLGWAPALTLAVFLLPIVAGLAGTLLPAFGWLPALGGQAFGLSSWRALAEAPGFATAWQLSLATGWLATVLSLVLALGVVAGVQRRRSAQRLGAWLAPLLAMPHSALAIGFAFLITPSGWLARLISPGLTGWAWPPDVSTVGHPSGWPLVAALLLKEVPYLVLMALAALNQVNAPAQLAAARALGYAPAQAWLGVVLPQVYRQIRLPVYAVLAFSLSVVDVALILGPGNPPTLAVLALRWFTHPDPAWIFPASAAATLLLLSVALSLLLWFGGERLAHRGSQWWLQRGVRGVASTWASRTATAVSALGLAAAVLATAALALWSLADQWRWPDAWPGGFSTAHWQRQASSLLGPALTTLGLGGAATLIALVLVLACLEHEAAPRRARAPAPAGSPARAAGAKRPARPGGRSLWLLYLPLLLPQVSFLFGLQVLLVRLGADGQFWAVVWAHLVFVLPYLFLSLADPWRAFDARYARAAASLGASRWRLFWRIKLPILLKPLLLSLAVAFAVSVGQYLPTVFAGAGRVVTLTTEAVTLASGADRRVIATWALLQTLFPLAVYLAAALVPAALYRQRKGLA